jgi:hypothetical protein
VYVWDSRIGSRFVRVECIEGDYIEALLHWQYRENEILKYLTLKCCHVLAQTVRWLRKVL